MTPSRRIFGLVVLCLVTGGSQHVNAAAARLTRSTGENEESKPVTTTARTEIVFIVTPEPSELPVTSIEPIMEQESEESTTFPGPMERDLEEAVTLQGSSDEVTTSTGPMERELEESVTLPGPMEQEESTTTFEPALARADIEQEAKIATTVSSQQESHTEQEQHISTTAMPACDEEKSASITSHDEATEKITSTTMKHPMRLLEFLKGSSKPRSRTYSETHTVKPKRKNNKNEFGARVKSSEDPVVVAGKTPRGARFFASASSFLSGLMPAVTPPSVRGGRAACPGPCHVNPMADLATIAAEKVQVNNASRRFPSIRKRPQTVKSITSISTSTTETPKTSTIRVPLSRFSARRRIEPTTTTTTTTAAPVEEQIVTTTTPEPEVTTTRNPRLSMFRKFKILQRSSTTNNGEN